MMDSTGQKEATAVAYDGDNEIVDDLGDALVLTQNGRAQVTENNRGHG
jgi:hypothetical protein